MERVFNLEKNMKKIKVLQIGMHDQMGGIENFLMNYYRNINLKKFQFDFLIPYMQGSKYDDEIKKIGGKIHKMSLKNDKNLFKFLKDLDAFFKNNSFDIVHCSDTGLGVFYLYFAKKYNVKVRIAHSHATNVEKGVKGILKKFLQKWYVKQANAFFSCSTEAGKYLFKNRKFQIIPNAINYSNFKFDVLQRENIRKKLNIDNETILIGNIGRICEQKNQKKLIEILSNLNEKYKLLIIGEGTLKNDILEKISEKKLQNRVIILEPVKDVYNYYNAMDIFILTSLYEGLPIVGIEAQANGLACLFSDTISKEVKYNDNIFFYDLNIDNKKIKNIIEELNLKRVDNIKNNYNICTCTKYLEECYVQLLER